MISPGDRIATSEEGLAGPGVFEENGELFSSFFGELKGNKAEFSVSRKNGVKEIRADDVIVGQVANIMPMICIIRIMGVERGGRIFYQGDSAILRISSVSNDYAKDFRDYLLVGDIVRARVTEIDSRGVNVTIVPPDCGVLTAYCSFCRSESRPIKRGLVECPSCGRRDSRKIAVQG